MNEIKKESLYIVMPAYNEEENIRQSVTGFLGILKYLWLSDSKVVVADSGSTDNTHKILKELQRDYPGKIEILSDTAKEHGPKIMALYKYAINKGADYVFQADSDCQVPPEKMIRYWRSRTKYNAIFGDRYDRKDGKIRAFVEKTVCFMLFMFFGVSVPDANAPFRLMRTESLKRYLHHIPEDYKIPNIVLTAYFAKYERQKIAFCRIPFEARQKGKNTINIFKILKIGIRSISDFLWFRMDMRYIKLMSKAYNMPEKFVAEIYRL